MASSKHQRYVLITGCSAGGIGAALCHQYANQDYHVFASTRDPSKIPQSLSSLPNVTTLALDVCSPSSIEAAVRFVQAATSNADNDAGVLDVIVHNAGGTLTAPVLDTPVDQARQQFELHVLAPLQVTQAFLPLLVRSKVGAAIVNISSIGGETNLPFQGLYGASKAALATMSETLRLEVQPLGMRVVTVVTGIIETKLHDNEKAVELSEDSFYKPLEGWIRERTEGTNRPAGMDGDEYARQVVEKIEKRGMNGKIYVGPLTPLFVWLKWWCPTFIWDRFMIQAGPKNQSELIKMEFERKKAQW